MTTGTGRGTSNRGGGRSGTRSGTTHATGTLSTGTAAAGTGTSATGTATSPNSNPPPAGPGTGTDAPPTDPASATTPTSTSQPAGNDTGTTTAGHGTGTTTATTPGSSTAATTSTSTQPPINLHTILQRANLSASSITAFLAHHSHLSISDFQDYLRYALDSGDGTPNTAFLIPASLQADAAWSPGHTHRLMQLARWFATVAPAGFALLDWDSLFTTDDFGHFCFPPKPSMPAPLPQSRTPTGDPAGTGASSGTVSAGDSAGAGAGASPPTYVHDYRSAVLQADAQDVQRRSTTGPLDDAPSPHPMWGPHAITGAANILTPEFLKAPVPTLTSVAPDVVFPWYRSLERHAAACNISLCPLRDFVKGQALWPASAKEATVFAMARVLAMKLEQDDVVNQNDAALQLLHRRHFLDNSSNLAAYSFLHDLLALANDMSATILNRLPQLQNATDVLTFATDLASFCRSEHLKGRSYTDWEASGYFLEELLAHGVPVTSYLKDLRDLPFHATVPSRLQITDLALTIHSQLQLHLPTAPVLGATRPTGLAHRLRDSTTPRSSTRPKPAADPTRSGHTSTSRPLSDEGDKHPFRQRADSQCQACGTFGHLDSNCSGLARHRLHQRYIDKFPAKADRVADAWLAHNNADTRRSTARHLQASSVPADTAAFDTDDPDHDTMFHIDDSDFP